MRSFILAIEKRTTAFALWCAIAMLVIAASAGMVQILSRFVFEQPAEWSEVIVRFALIWMVFLAIPTAFREGAMISVDLLYSLSGPTFRRVLATLGFAASLTLMFVMLWWGQDYAWRARFQTIPGIESFSMLWAYAAIPAGASFAIVAIVAQWLDPRRHELETAL